VVIFHPLLCFGLLEALNVASDKTTTTTKTKKNKTKKKQKLVLDWGTRNVAVPESQVELVFIFIAYVAVVSVSF